MLLLFSSSESLACYMCTIKVHVWPEHCGTVVKCQAIEFEVAGPTILKCFTQENQTIMPMMTELMLYENEINAKTLSCDKYHFLLG